MNYTSSLQYLDSFINYERLKNFPKNREFNLSRMAYLLEIFDHPERGFYPVIIAGTNGKGTVGTQLQALLNDSRISAGFYSSPHLFDVKERITIQGKILGEKLWAQGLTEMKQKLSKNPLPKKFGKLTYFEVLTFLAILLFAKSRVKVGVFEVGLGGRLDAVNVLKAQTVVITQVDFDHEAFLGNTLKKITAEKAQVIKQNCDVMTFLQPGEVMEVVEKQIEKTNSRLKVVNAKTVSEINALMAVWAYRSVCRRFNQTPKPLTKTKRLALSTSVAGRMHLIKKKGRTFLLDVAHNPASIERLVSKVKKMKGFKSKWLVYGALKDKKTSLILKSLFGVFENSILTEVNNPRSASQEELFQAAAQHGKKIFLTENTGEALELVRTLSNQGDLVVITGSFYLVGEAITLISKGK